MLERQEDDTIETVMGKSTSLDKYKEKQEMAIFETVFKDDQYLQLCTFA